MKERDKYRGCLIGGAAGDALGYAVEFLYASEILARYGKNGITEYDLKNGVAEISDDTQMTLFTAEGLLSGAGKGGTCGRTERYLEAIRLSYREWYRTQTESYPLSGQTFSRLAEIPELFSCRAPGATCLQALSEGGTGSTEHPINRSKGCGGVMRVAPIGLFFDGSDLTVDEMDRLGAEAAAITHGHPLGTLPAAALVHLVHLLSHTEITMLDAVMEMQKSIGRLFRNDAYLKAFLDLTQKAVRLSQAENLEDVKAIGELGEGWVAEETLAIALYCALKYPDDFEKALIASVNHSGDSDSTGSVTGNLVGARLGLSGIPQKFLDSLELKDVLLKVADDLFCHCPPAE